MADFKDQSKTQVPMQTMTSRRTGQQVGPLSHEDLQQVLNFRDQVLMYFEGSDQNVGQLQTAESMQAAVKNNPYI